MTDNAGHGRVDDLDVLLENEADEADEEFSGALALSSDTFAQWHGDQGNLDPKQRDTLVALLKKSFISSDDKDAWRTLMRDPDPIVTNLNNLYFILVVDERAEVAFATPARNADNPFKTLVRDAPNNREETLLLIYLRERHRAETASGQPTVYADVAAMLDYVARFRPASATDVSGDEKRVKNAVGGLVTSGLLIKTADADRYRVHRAIEALLPLPTLSQLVEAFRAHNAAGPIHSTGDGEGNSTEEIGDQLVDEEGEVA